MSAKVLLLLSFAYLILATAVNGQNCRILPEGTFFPDPISCAHYYRCIHGSPMRHSCPKGTYWSQHSVTCDHTYNVDCNNQGTTEQSTTQCGTITTPGGGPSCTGTPEDGVIPHPTSCRSYYQCRNNIAVLVTCPDGQLYDYKSQFCVLSTLANCYPTAT